MTDSASVPAYELRIEQALRYARGADVMPIEARELFGALVNDVERLREVVRDALPSLGANRRSYAQLALEAACEILDEPVDAWRGEGELALEQEWRSVLEGLVEFVDGVKLPKLITDTDVRVKNARNALEGGDGS